MANLYLGMLGRLAEVAPKPGQCCCTPATQLELSHWIQHSSVVQNGPSLAQGTTVDNLQHPRELLPPTLHPLISMPVQFNQPLWNLGLEFSGMGTCTADVNSTQGGFQCLAFRVLPGSLWKCQSSALLLCGSQQRGLQLCEILTPLWCDRPLQHGPALQPAVSHTPFLKCSADDSCKLLLQQK